MTAGVVPVSLGATRPDPRGRMSSSAPRLPTNTATGGSSAATTLITTAAVVDHSRTTFHASTISTTQVPISAK